MAGIFSVSRSTNLTRIEARDSIIQLRSLRIPNVTVTPLGRNSARQNLFTRKMFIGVGNERSWNEITDIPISDRLS